MAAGPARELQGSNCNLTNLDFWQQAQQEGSNCNLTDKTCHGMCDRVLLYWRVLGYVMEK